MKKTILSLSCALWLSIPAATAQVNLDSLDAVYDSLSIGEVSVTAAKPMVKMEADKMTYDVAADNDSKSSTVLDMLRKVPMVTVDGQDNITVNGSSAFKVYVDGKPNPMFSQNASQIFKMMPAAAVAKIEIITNPGAKYDAEGAVGVLNIVLAKQPGGGAAQVNGTTGTVRAQVGNQRVGGGVWFSSQQGKLSASGNAMAFHQWQKMETTLDREAFADGRRSQYFQNSKQRVPGVMGNLSLSYDIDSLNVVSAAVSVTDFTAKMDSNPIVRQNQVEYTYFDRVKMKNTSFNASADWQHFFSPERNRYLTLSYQLSYTPQKLIDEQHYEAPMPDIYLENRPKSLEQTLQFDYTTPIAANQTLNLGGKYILRNNRSWSEAMEYHHGNHIAAAYVEHEAKFGKLATKAGLRYEHTWQKVEYERGAGTDFKSNYGNLVPSASLSFSPSMTKNIGLTYNLRLSRPGISYLNPYIDRHTPTVVTYGNSNLDVEQMHNIGLSYSSFSQKFMLNLGLRQSFTNNQIAMYGFIKDDLLNLTYGNVAKWRNTSLTAFVNWLATKNTRLMLNGALDYTDLRSSTLDMKNSGWHANLMAGLQQTLPADFKLGLNAILNTKSYTLQGWMSGYELLVANLSKDFLDKRLNVAIIGITGLHDRGAISMDMYHKDRDHTQMQHIRVPVSQVMLSVSYTFGKQGVKAKEHKSRIKNDFMEKKSEQEQVPNATGTM